MLTFGYYATFMLGVYERKVLQYAKFPLFHAISKIGGTKNVFS